jgi:GYF domain 2
MFSSLMNATGDRMPYQISREGQLYGPYTLEDLQRYVTSGNVLLTDLAKSEEMAEWLPVSQILATSAPAAVAPAEYIPPAPPAYPPTPYATPGAAYPGSASPPVPDLNWGLLLVINLFTCGLMQAIWNIVVSNWARRLDPSSKAFMWYVVSLILILANFGSSYNHRMGHMHEPARQLYMGFGFAGLTIGLVTWVVRLIARFTLRDTLERHYNTVDPIGLRLNPVMTFFFGGLYFQYKLNEINRMKQSGLRYPAPY